MKDISYLIVVLIALLALTVHRIGFGSDCGLTEVEVKPGLIFNDREDALALQRALVGCAQHFPDSPCLKKFIKLDERRYQAVCGTK